MSRQPDSDVERITEHLIPGKFPLWVCRPHFRIRTNAYLVLFAGIIPFFLMAGFFIWTIGQALGLHPTTRWAVATIVFALVVVSGLTVFWERRRRSTVYALTSLRVLIVRHRSLTALPLRALAEWTCAERGNGYGDLVFGRLHRFHLTTEDDLPPTGLYNIANVKAVHVLLDSAQRATFGLPPRDPKLAASLAVD